MNKQLHRVIFNAARGERMAVHEAASSNSGRGRLKVTALAAFVALVSQGQFAVAQIAGDPSAPANQRPVVVTAPNGTPLVNIQTPSAGGVSRNTYRQFDVDGRGANAKGNVAAPARIEAGGNLNIALAVGRNVQGQILAGGLLHVEGGAIANEPETLKLERQVQGDAIHTFVKGSGPFGSDKRVYDKSSYSSSEPLSVKLTAGKVEGGQAGLGVGSIGSRNGGFTFSPTCAWIPP